MKQPTVEYEKTVKGTNEKRGYYRKGVIMKSCLYRK